MRVKIGEQWFDSEDTPICVEFSESDKRNIDHMDFEEASKYASAPDGWFDSRESFLSWMSDEKKSSEK